MINTLSSNLEKSVLVTTKPNAFFEIKLTRDISQQPKKNKKKTYKGYYGKYNWTTTLGDTMKILKKKRQKKKNDILISQI